MKPPSLMVFSPIPTPRDLCRFHMLNFALTISVLAPLGWDANIADTVKFYKQKGTFSHLLSRKAISDAGTPIRSIQLSISYGLGGGDAHFIDQHSALHQFVVNRNHLHPATCDVLCWSASVLHCRKVEDSLSYEIFREGKEPRKPKNEQL